MRVPDVHQSKGTQLTCKKLTLGFSAYVHSFVCTPGTRHVSVLCCSFTLVYYTGANSKLTNRRALGMRLPYSWYFLRGCNFRVFRGRVGSAKINLQKSMTRIHVRVVGNEISVQVKQRVLCLSKYSLARALTQLLPTHVL